MSKYIDSILGHAIGDAMGVPVEFCIREKLKKNPVTKMIGFGSHPVPAGVWSDDTSMEIATIDSFINNKGFNYTDIMNNFVKWVSNGEFTADGKVFDIGKTCLRAIRSYTNGSNPIDAGQKDLMSNGNGSLMRMLPVALFSYDMKLNDNDIMKLVGDVSSLTHGHEISKLGCYIYVRLAMFLMDGMSKENAYLKIRGLNYSIYEEEHLTQYDRIIKNDIRAFKLNDIKSSGYVVDTLEASVWVLLNCDNYKHTIIGAINLGNDTDTIGAIAGSLAGIIYGFEGIPKEWLEVLAKKDYLIDLSNKFERTVKSL